MNSARYFRTREDGAVQCDLCPHACVLREGEDGRCRVRGVRDGELIALTYGAVSSAHVDPIEKKPLYHFHPGGSIFSVGGWGCNFACGFCQNWSISQQVQARGTRHSPKDIVKLAGAHGSVGVAYTYNEPMVNFEFVRDCAQLVREAGFLNVLVTNGFLNLEPAAELLPWIDALNIDIKSMDEDFYKTQCKGRLAPVLAFSEAAAHANCHVEITNLLIPGLNEQDTQVVALAEWVGEHLGPETPLHLSAYRPSYRSKTPSTPVATLQSAFAVCRRTLSYVYMGNVLTSSGQNTECPGCGNLLVRRWTYTTEVVGIRDGACSSCGRAADFVL